MGIVNSQFRLHNGDGIQGLGRIRGLGQLQPSAFPTTEVAVGATGAGLLIGGLVIKKMPGTVMAVAGGAAVLTSGVLLLMKMIRSSAPAVPLPPSAPPPPPPAPKPTVTSTEKIMSYVNQYAPAINQLFSKLFGANRQPGMMVAHGRGR